MTSACNKKSCIISVIAVTVFLMGYGFLVHGILLKPDYVATASLWRTPAEMEALFPYGLLFPLAFAVLFTCWFKYSTCQCPCCLKAQQCMAEDGKKSCCPIKSGGLCFGAKLGLLMGLIAAQTFFWLPIPLDLAIKWFFAGLGQGLGVGIILGIFCDKMAGSCTTQANKANN